MPPPIKFPVKISPLYVAELRARVEAIGVVAVARAAGLARGTVWRQIRGGEGVTPNAIESIRRAVTKLDPQGAPVPPSVVAVRGAMHHHWIALADDVTANDLEREIADVVKRRGRRK